MMETTLKEEYRRLKKPKAAATAGILFGLLFAASMILMRSAIPQKITADIDWVISGEARIRLALGLIPFAGVAYLWFIGVVRDRLGDYEDRFLSTVFFGSSLLSLAMTFISNAIAGAILTYVIISEGTPDYSVIHFGRALMLQINNVYALRMAGVTMISLGTIWLLTGLMPRWLAIVTYTLAFTLLVVVNFSLWVTLVFPAWVAFISLLFLRGQKTKAPSDPSPSWQPHPPG